MLLLLTETRRGSIDAVESLPRTFVARARLFPTTASSDCQYENWTVRSQHARGSCSTMRVRSLDPKRILGNPETKKVELEIELCAAVDGINAVALVARSPKVSRQIASGIPRQSDQNAESPNTKLLW